MLTIERLKLVLEKSYVLSPTKVPLVVAGYDHTVNHRPADRDAAVTASARDRGLLYHELPDRRHDQSSNLQHLGHHRANVLGRLLQSSTRDLHQRLVRLRFRRLR